MGKVDLLNTSVCFKVHLIVQFWDIFVWCTIFITQPSALESIGILHVCSSSQLCEPGVKVQKSGPNSTICRLAGRSHPALEETWIIKKKVILLYWFWLEINWMKKKRMKSVNFYDDLLFVECSITVFNLFLLTIQYHISMEKKKMGHVKSLKLWFVGLLP